jgi:hypothetical protein
MKVPDQVTHIHVTRIAAMRIIFTRIGCTLLTCNMYMSDLRLIHDPVLSSLKMEGTRLLLFIVSLPLPQPAPTPTPPRTRAHTCAYVTRMKDKILRSFEMRHVIHDTRFSSGQ